MSTGANDGNTKTTTEVPPFPGEHFLAHEGTQYKELAIASLISAGLYGVAQGLNPPGFDEIIDYDLDEMPPLPEGHRDANRRLEQRSRAQMHNKANAAKRIRLRMEVAWRRHRRWPAVVGRAPRDWRRCARGNGSERTRDRLMLDSHDLRPPRGSH